MRDEPQAKWRPCVGSVWRRRESDDELYRVRFTVIGFDDEDVIYRRSTDGEVLRRPVHFWIEGMKRI
jgi:hypothetical protein